MLERLILFLDLHNRLRNLVADLTNYDFLDNFLMLNFHISDFHAITLMTTLIIFLRLNWIYYFYEHGTIFVILFLFKNVMGFFNNFKILNPFFSIQTMQLVHDFFCSLTLSHFCYIIIWQSLQNDLLGFLIKVILCALSNWEKIFTSKFKRYASNLPSKECN